VNPARGDLDPEHGDRHVLVTRGSGLDIDDEQVLTELRGAGEDRTRAVDDDRGS